LQNPINISFARIIVDSVSEASAEAGRLAYAGKRV
jgi:hypothetical protein